MTKQAHALLLKIPEHGGVVQEALLSDGLSVPAKLDITKTVICKPECPWYQRVQAQ